MKTNELLATTIIKANEVKDLVEKNPIFTDEEKTK